MQNLILAKGKQSKMVNSAKRHFQSIFKYMTLRKGINIFIGIIEMLLRRSVVISHPFYLRIEVSPYCNLHCPGCLLGGANLSESNPEHRKEKIMNLNLFQNSVHDFLPYLIKANLYDEGEPLLNKDIPKMINHLSKNNIATCISSNFSLKLSEEYLTQLLSSGLDHLIVAVDGATQESYSIYRKGGDLALVVNNLERVISIKKKIDSSLQVDLQFLEFPHNKHEREAVYNLAMKLGVDRFTVNENCSLDGWEGDRFRGPEEERRKKGCYQSYISTTISSIGEIGCCDYGEDHGIPMIGMASNYSRAELRNHPTIVELRRSFNRNSNSLNAICQHCSETTW
jgi:MoaA/NifB/PqqE/SkfB family radical SAM enzyme